MTHINCKVYVSTPHSQLHLCYKNMVLLFYSFITSKFLNSHTLHNFLPDTFNFTQQRALLWRIQGSSLTIIIQIIHLRLTEYKEPM